MASLLLKNGVVLLHGEGDKVHPTRTDILIQGNIIAGIESGITAPNGAEIIDCSDKIISPGFIDGHQHVWQTLNRGRHADETLLEYMPTGFYTSFNHSKEDIFWGQLGGVLTLINSGTTTVVDHAHIHYTPEASETAISATVSSGIRSVFCFTPTPRVSSWNPMVLNPDILEPWVLSSFSSLTEKAPFGPNGRVQLGLAYDGWFLPQEAVAPLFEIATKGNVKFLTTHVVGTIGSDVSSVQKLKDWGITDHFRAILSHATALSDEAINLIVKHNAFVASTPSTELQMGHGRPVCFDDNIRTHACLGGDCHSNGGFSIPGEMRLGLQAERGIRNQKIIDGGKSIKSVHRTAEQAFNLGTIQGARALGMEDKIGSIGVGKLADLVVFDAESPSMISAAQNDPVAAVVLFSTPGDISMVIIDGVVRKSEGQLLPVQFEGGARDIAGQEMLRWKDIGKRILERRESYRKDIDKIDFQEALGAVKRAWHIDETSLADTI